MYETRERMLSALLYYKRIVRQITSTLMRRNPHYVLSYVFLEYLHRRLQRIFKQILKWVALPDTAFKRILNDLEVRPNEYVDRDSCAVANVQLSGKSQSSAWVNVGSMMSMAKYKLMIISVPDISENTVLISEMMEHNLRNALCCEQLDDSCFIRKNLQLAYQISNLNFKLFTSYDNHTIFPRFSFSTSPRALINQCIINY